MFNIDAVMPYLPFLLVGVPLTLGITAAAFVVGTTTSLPLALIRLARVPALNATVVVWVEFFRTTPPLVHIVWMYYAFPVMFGLRLSDLSVVIAALAASTSAQMTEVFRSGIQSIPKGQVEVAVVLGFGPVQRLWYIVLPQTIRLIMAPSTNTLISLMKDSSLAAVIAIPELMNRGQVLSTQIYRPLEILTIVGVLYFVLTYPLVIVAAALERRSRAGFRLL